jgi:hypothetical protein
VRAKPSFGTRSLTGGDMDEKSLFGVQVQWRRERGPSIVPARLK